METGIELIAIERQEQIEKHGRTVKSDVENNDLEQLALGAELLLAEDVHQENAPPYGWNGDLWRRMIAKPYKERLIIAGALIAAEIDRLNACELTGN